MLLKWCRRLIGPWSRIPQRRAGQRHASCRPSLEALEDRLAPAIFLVKTVGDASSKPTLVPNPRNNPALVNVYNAPTLRGAIEMAETIDPTKGPRPAKYNTILFQIGNGVETNMVGSATKGAALPAINTYPIMIDGSPPKDSSGVVIQKYANQVIVLNGSNATAGSNGLTISAGNSVVRGLVIDSFKRNDASAPGLEGGNGIALLSKGNNTIQANLIGTDSTGTMEMPNQGDGVFVNLSPNNLIGGPTNKPGTSPGNLLSGNILAGVEIAGFGSSGNQVQGNLIGTNKDGKNAIKNTNANANGVVINGAPNNVIGGSMTGK